MGENYCGGCHGAYWSPQDAEQGPYLDVGDIPDDRASISGEISGILVGIGWEVGGGAALVDPTTSSEGSPGPRRACPDFSDNEGSGAWSTSGPTSCRTGRLQNQRVASEQNEPDPKRHNTQASVLRQRTKTQWGSHVYAIDR